MNQPLLPQRVGAADLDGMLAETDDMLDFERLVERLTGGADPRYDPDDAVKIAAYHMYLRGDPFLEWLFDLTRRSAFPPASETIEANALAAERYRARLTLGDMIACAIAEGQKLDSPDRKEDRHVQD